MGTLIAAYAIMWLAVALYVARLGYAQRRLETRLQSLLIQIEESRTATERLTRLAG